MRNDDERWVTVK